MQAEIHSKSLFWLRFRVSDRRERVPKMFLNARLAMTPANPGLSSVSSRQLINQRRQRVVGQMIQKLTDGIQSFPTRRTPCHNYAAPALRN